MLFTKDLEKLLSFVPRDIFFFKVKRNDTDLGWRVHGAIFRAGKGVISGMWNWNSWQKNGDPWCNTQNSQPRTFFTWSNIIVIWGKTSIAAREACSVKCLIFKTYRSESPRLLIERGGMLDLTCKAETVEFFIIPKTILRNEFCAASRECNAFSEPPAYTTTPHSMIGSTIDLYRRSSVARSAPPTLLSLYCAIRRR